MFSSDDSLFDEMTKQLEDDTARPEIDRNLLRNSPISNKTMSTTTQDQETLPDIVYTSNRTDAVTGLLMLGADPKDLDVEIDNELIMPINKPKQQNQNNFNTDANNNEQNKRNKKRRNHDTSDSPRRSTRQASKSSATKTTSTMSIFPSSQKSPGSPCGVLKVTHYKLRKGMPNKYVSLQLHV